VAAGENGALLQSGSLSSPQISVSSTTLDFGSVHVGDSSTQTLTITNSGSADLIIQGLTISGANIIDFTTQNDLCGNTTLPPSQNCTVQIVFSPHFTGSEGATLSIPSNDPNTPTQAIALSGSSTAPSTGGTCFISFLADASGRGKYLDLFRKFRDLFLLESAFGRRLVDFYYQHSPSLASFLTRHNLLKDVACWGLPPLGILSYAALYTSPVEKIFLFVLMNGVVAAWFIIRGRSKRLREGRVGEVPAEKGCGSG
jgi:hypothetical protein